MPEMDSGPGVGDIIVGGTICASSSSGDSAELDVSFDTIRSGNSIDSDGEFEVIHVRHPSSPGSKYNRWKSRQTRTSVEMTEAITSVDSSGSKITLYQVNVESNDICFHLPTTCVWRSYSDFVWLRKRLASSCSFMKRKIPALPSWYLLNTFNKEFIERRKQGLQEFLQQVVQDRSFLSDAAVHLFLQSSLLTEEIQAWLDKEVDDPVVELIQRGKELVTSSSDHSSLLQVSNSDELVRSTSSDYASDYESLASAASSSY